MTNEDLLHHFFSNSLNKAEEKQFNKLLETDANFKAQFEFENNLKHAIKYKENKALKDKLIDFENEIKVTKTKNTSTKFNWRIAASIIILLGASWFGYQSFFSTNYEALFEDNFTNYPNTVYTITRDDTANSIERDAFVAYETNDYELAIKNFKKIPLKAYANFYLAQSYLELNDVKSATKYFKLTLKNDKVFKAETNWYLALIAVKQKNKSIAKDYLQNLIDNFEYKKEEAKTLLKQLD